MCIIYFMYFLFPSHLKHFLFLGLVVPGPESYPVCHDQLSRMKKQSEGLSSCLQISVSVRSSVRLCVFLYNVTSKQTKKTNRLTLTNENVVTCKKVMTVMRVLLMKNLYFRLKIINIYCQFVKS